MLITCVGLVTPTHILPPTIQRPLQFTILTDRWRQIALASLSALSHVTCRIYMLRSTHTVFWRQLYRNIFAILSWQRCVAAALALWLFYCHIYLQSSRTHPYTPLHSTSCGRKQSFLFAFFVEPGLRMRFQQPERYVRKLAFFFCFSFPIFGPLWHFTLRVETHCLELTYWREIESRCDKSGICDFCARPSAVWVLLAKNCKNQSKLN